MILRLSREGVFPIVVGLDGSPLSANTGFTLAGTIQGEGKLCGMPSLFVRTQGCNLRCRWQTPYGVSQCDTSHTWTAAEGCDMPVADVVRLIELNIGEMRHVVITGGEPALQISAVAELIDALHDRRLHVTVETNGTVSAPQLAKADLLSISPKLSSSGISEKMRMQTRNSVGDLVRCAKECGHDVQLKFVVGTETDAAEIVADYSAVGLLPSDFLVMPLGVSPTDMRQSAEIAVRMAVRHGWRFSPRLHIDLFGNKEGT